MQGNGPYAKPWGVQTPKSSADHEPDMEKTVPDRGESVGLIAPLLVSETLKHHYGLGDLTVDLAAKAAGLRRSLPSGGVSSLADLARRKARPRKGQSTSPRRAFKSVGT